MILQHLTVRLEAPVDAPAIDDIITLAFNRQAEAKLVHTLRSEGLITLALVAEVADQRVGYILFCPVVIFDDQQSHPAISLGPIAVLPDWQHQGVGSVLVQRGLAHLQQAGHTIVTVLGNPAFYTRFGFEPAMNFNIRCQYDVPPAAFMVKVLQSAALCGKRGTVHYPSVFDSV